VPSTSLLVVYVIMSANNNYSVWFFPFVVVTKMPLFVTQSRQFIYTYKVIKYKVM